jgi:hypothetical protein
MVHVQLALRNGFSLARVALSAYHVSSRMLPGICHPWSRRPSRWVLYRTIRPVRFPWSPVRDGAPG